MESFKDYIAQPSPLTLPSQEVLEKILSRYPWCTTAQIAWMQQTGRCNPWLKVRFQYGMISPLLEKPISIDEYRKRSTMEIIDTFLHKGEYRIVPKEDTPDYQPDTDQSEEGEFITEELAEIYLAQGLKSQAKETYRKLSLLYPKKSVYFAEIIAKIDTHSNEDPAATSPNTENEE